jgi:hypothetical protein
MAIKNADAARDFVNGWIAAGEKLMEDKVDVWREVMANVLVLPYPEQAAATTNPYGKPRSHDVRNMVLKDPESSQIAETFRDNIMGALFSDPEGKYLVAAPIGYEDDNKADTVTRLLRYDLGLEGIYRTLSETMLDLAMFGTAVLESPWRTDTKDIIVREVTEQGGVTFDRQFRDKIQTYNDPEVCQVDLLDWYPDVEEPRLEKGRGAAKGFKITPNAARAAAEEGTYNAEAVEKAIGKAVRAWSNKQEQRKRELRHRTDAASHASSFDDNFDFMKAYEYWGEVPWEAADGVQRRVVTIMNGVIVRNDPWPLVDPDLPFHVLVINPVKGRHYGKAPAEIVRYAQDFADAMLMLIAEATVRQVHPPIAIDISKDVDPGAVRAWDPDAVIAVDGPTTGAVNTVEYASNIFQGTQFQQQLKVQMQQASGALGPVQGLGLGVNRASATEAQQTFSKAMTKIEAVAQLLEKDGLPSLARGLLRRNQQFLEDRQDLVDRVGELPESTWLGDIMGDFDVQFVGTRNAISRQVKLQAYDRLVALSQAMPQMVAARVPWDKVLERLFGEILQAPEIGAVFSAPDAQAGTMMNNMILQAMAAQAGADQGGAPTTGQPPGLSPEQAAGAELEV